MSNRARQIIAGVITVALAAIVVAGLIAGDPTPEDRVDSLGQRIKCPVCQGVTIAESPSKTAQTMMEITREKVAAGWTDDQIIQYFEDRYNTAILVDPPFSGKTLLVWLLPVVALIAGVALILSKMRSRRKGVS
ncbi:MAG TPA: cytochrome c-type biogenesis protein CcmH [Actinobacteria bacterium]|nr:cytochrome c-type biogenesis protein CcmH precursor [bacterium BMS3Bbin01]HDH26756.1 cytochrome c-type biogenesis protein CcmH [Actinomycetota bacterium]